MNPRHFLRDTSAAWAPLLLVTAVYFSIILIIALAYPFPSPFDELGHVSVVCAQFERPDLFADTRAYMLVHADDVSRWSGNPNYINHPALYYLGLSPLLGFDDQVLALRLANVALSMLALGIMLTSDWMRLFRCAADRVMFAIIAASFPKSALTGGMVSNDNLAMVAAALVFSGMSGSAWGGLMVAGGLALAGWTKLTALIALAAAVAIKTLLDHNLGLFRRANWLALGGIIIGALPYLVSLARTGKLFHVNIAIFASAPGTKPNWDFADYMQKFFLEIVSKWPAAEASLPLVVGTVLILAPLIFATIGTLKDARVRRIGIAYLAATIVTLSLHFAFGWQSFQTIGDLTISQTRYYNVLWPGIALAGAAAIAQLRHLRYPAQLLYLVPTVIGGTVLALF
jgi:hypothetical protein